MNPINGVNYPLERQIELKNNKQALFDYLKRNPNEVDRVVDMLIKDYKKNEK